MFQPKETSQAKVDQTNFRYISNSYVVGVVESVALILGSLLRIAIAPLLTVGTRPWAF